MVICTKQPSSQFPLELLHLFPVNELLTSVKLQPLTFVLFKSKLQNPSGRLLLPATVVPQHDVKLCGAV